PSEIYPRSLHDALPISIAAGEAGDGGRRRDQGEGGSTLAGDPSRRAITGEIPWKEPASAQRIGKAVLFNHGAVRQAGKLCGDERDRKSTRLNSSHVKIS